MTKTLHVHFVCRGNVFRSRLAEAYAASHHNPALSFSSSGIEATLYPVTFVSTWTKNISTKHHLQNWMKPQRRQTTSALLQHSDLIVFMNTDVYEAARQQYDFNPAICLVWRVKDIGDWQERLGAEQKRIRTFRHIKRNVDRLLQLITSSGWVDIVDANDHDLGFSLPVRLANQRRLWHRGCHVLITTPNQGTIIQKRSSGITFSPDKLDVTLGGHVDAGETPLQAALRETREELGLVAAPEALRLLEIRKWNSYHPRNRQRTQAFLYTYHLVWPENQPAFELQASEVAAAQVVSPRQLRRLLLYHSLRHLGRLNFPYAYYRRIVALAAKNSPQPT